MKLSNVALAFVLAALFVKTNDAQAGGDMSGVPPEKDVRVERHEYPRRQYYPGHAYGYEPGMNYVFGSYYRPYRMHYYSYSYPDYIPVRRWYHFRRYRDYYRARRYAPYQSYSYRYR